MNQLRVVQMAKKTLGGAYSYRKFTPTLRWLQTERGHQKGSSLVWHRKKCQFWRRKRRLDLNCGSLGSESRGCLRCQTPPSVPTLCTSHSLLVSPRPAAWQNRAPEAAGVSHSAWLPPLAPLGRSAVQQALEALRAWLR